MEGVTRLCQQHCLILLALVVVLIIVLAVVVYKWKSAPAATTKTSFTPHALNSGWRYVDTDGANMASSSHVLHRNNPHAHSKHGTSPSEAAIQHARSMKMPPWSAEARQEVASLSAAGATLDWGSGGEYDHQLDQLVNGADDEYFKQQDPDMARVLSEEKQLGMV